MSIQIDWPSHFDSIRCIHFLPNEDRLPRLETELKRVGIFQSPVFSYKYTYKTIFDSYIRSKVRITCPTFNNFNRQDLVTNLLLAYYQIFKEAIGLKQKKIAVLEDDVVFTDDLDLLNESMKAMPDDWDYIHFDKLLNRTDKYRLAQSKPVNKYYNTYPGGYWGTCFTGFSTKAMELFCSLTENEFWPADCTLENRKPDTGISLKRYVPINQLVHQFGLDDHYTKLYF